MIDWSTASALATGAGTLVLAVATFAAVRSSNRTARVAEQAFRLALRPLLMPSRLEDGTQKIRWVDDHWAHVDGGRACVEVANDHIYLAMSVRNAGNGIAVLQAWHIDPTFAPGRDLTPRDQFRPHGRDLYIPAGDVGFWQAAVRDRNDPLYGPLCEAIESRHSFTVEVLYGDLEGGQHSISRFAVTPAGEERWLVSVSRHWRLDGTDPRIRADT